jgi:hypothetical protein
MVAIGYLPGGIYWTQFKNGLNREIRGYKAWIMR